MVNSGIIINTDGCSVDEKVHMKSEEKGSYFSSLVGFAKSSISNAIKYNNS